MRQGLVNEMAEEYLEYLKDESRTVGMAESISFPKNEGEVVRIMQQMYLQKCPVTIQGARTGLAAGAVPKEGHVMNLTRMNGIGGMRRDEEGYYYLRVAPGLALSELRKKIEQKNLWHSTWSEESKGAYDVFSKGPEQFFSPDPTETSATIGGMVACNASGARSYFYGPIRRYVTGLRVVLSDGQTLSLRRGESTARGHSLCLVTEQGTERNISLPRYRMPETKNASGYYVHENMDAIDLFIGSDGTLGVLTEIEIKLLPMPPVVWGVTCFFHREEEAVACVDPVRSTMTDVAAMEYFDGDALKILRKQKETGTVFAQLPEIPARMQAALYVEFHCQSEKEAMEQLLQTGICVEAAGGRRTDTWVARVDVDRDRLMFFRHAVPESVNMLIDQRKKQYPGLTKLGTDMAVPNEHLAAIIKTYREALQRQGLESAVWGHIGNNHLHVNILPENQEDYEAGKIIYAQWAEEVTRLGGAVSAEHGVGKQKSHFLEVMYGKEAVMEMVSLKKSLDPEGLLGRDNLFVWKEGGDHS